MKNCTKKILCFIFLLLSCCNTFAKINAADIASPKKQSLSNWVSNPDGILSHKTEDKLNRMLNLLYDSTTCQVCVVVIKGDKETSARELSMELFDAWHIGIKGKDNGAIMLIITEKHEYFLRTGYGVEDILTDAISTRIFSQKMKSHFIKGEWNEGVLSGTEEICSLLNKNYLEENSTQHLEKRTNLTLFLKIYLAIGFLFFIFATIVLVRSTKNIEYTYRTKRFNTLKKNYNNIVVFSFIIMWWLLPIFHFIYKRLQNRIRKESVYCSCGEKMHLLNEKEEDRFLSSTEQLEETLGTRDYDVWHCPKCGKITVYAYEQNDNYEICPVCHAKTYKKISKEIIHSISLKEATIIREHYLCKNCNHRAHKDTEQNDSAPFIVGGTLGGLSGGFGGGEFSNGGGFSGGNFGGGLSGGGGGGGSW